MASIRALKRLVIPVVFFAVTGALVFLAGNGLALGDLPVVVERTVELPKADTCKYCRRHIRTGEIRKDAVVIVENQVRAGMTERGMGSSGAKKSPYINVLIYRFEERRGGNYAADRPAKVGFHMHLMDEGTVRKLFVFDEDQQALSQNVLNIGKFLRRGGKWLTAEQLSAEGVEAGLDYLLEGLE